MSMNLYTYSVRFTDSDQFPWKWTVYLNGQPLASGFSESTGMAMTRWGARLGARLYIRRHRKHHGESFGPTLVR